MPLTDAEIAHVLGCGLILNPNISTIIEVEPHLLDNQTNEIIIPKDQECKATQFISNRYCRLIRLDTDADPIRSVTFSFVNPSSGARAMCDRILIAITPKGQIVVMPIEQKGGDTDGYDYQLRNGKLFARFLVSTLATELGVAEDALNVCYVPVLLCNKRIHTPRQANVSTGTRPRVRQFEPLREAILPALKAKCGDIIRLEKLIDTFFREFPEQT